MSVIEARLNEYGDYEQILSPGQPNSKETIINANAIIVNKHLTGEKICEELFNTPAIKSIFGGNRPYPEDSEVIIRVGGKGVIYDIFEE